MTISAVFKRVFALTTFAGIPLANNSVGEEVLADICIV